MVQRWGGGDRNRCPTANTVCIKRSPYPIKKVTTPVPVEGGVAGGALPMSAGSSFHGRRKPNGSACQRRTMAGVQDEPSLKPTPRAGTKQALMIEMLRRPEGATVEQIAAATGWQHHTIRGAISGALKKKLGLTVETTRTREVGSSKTGAKGSTTVYRITGSGPAAS